jgi:hypothetical protein
MFENRMLRKIFGPEGNEVAGGWRKLRNEELCDLYSFRKYNCKYQVEEHEMVEVCSKNGEENCV